MWGFNRRQAKDVPDRQKSRWAGGPGLTIQNDRVLQVSILRPGIDEPTPHVLLFPIPCLLQIISPPRRTINPWCLFEPARISSPRHSSRKEKNPGGNRWLQPPERATSKEFSNQCKASKSQYAVLKPQKAPKNARKSFVIESLRITPLEYNSYSDTSTVSY